MLGIVRPVSPGEFLSAAGVAVCIREASDFDAFSIIGLVRAVLAEGAHFALLPEEFQPSRIAQEEKIREYSAHPDRLLLVAAVGKRIVGLVDASGDPRKRASHSAWMSIMIAREFRHQGIGSRLMQVLFRWAESRPNLNKICLTVLSTNTAAREFYDRLGFCTEGMRRRAVQLQTGVFCDEVLLCKWIPSDADSA
jgi:RimJ/RimL family protein N-acetyltransferase